MAEAVTTIIRKLFQIIYPYTHITFPEYTGDFSYIHRYLNAACISQANDFNVLVPTIPYNELFTDEFEGAEVWWTFIETPKENQKRYFRLTFHRQHSKAMITRYLTHVISKGKSIAFKEKGPTLYINQANGEWATVPFEHPVTFDTLIMDPQWKIAIVNDLTRFSKSKDSYARVGKAWIRNFVMTGPAKTGKSTLIAAMANLLEYDIYQVSLLSVKDNTELKKLLFHTSNKSIVVIQEKSISEYISSLLTPLGGGRITVFKMEWLDPTLDCTWIDMHIKLSYCRFQEFKVLAKNYLDIEGHDLFDKIGEMLDRKDMTPMAVAVYLTPYMYGEDVRSCLLRLIKALEKTSVKLGRHSTGSGF